MLSWRNVQISVWTSVILCTWMSALLPATSGLVYTDGLRAVEWAIIDSAGTSFIDKGVDDRFLRRQGRNHHLTVGQPWQDSADGHKNTQVKCAVHQTWNDTSFAKYKHRNSPNQVSSIERWNQAQIEGQIDTGEEATFGVMHTDPLAITNMVDECRVLQTSPSRHHHRLWKREIHDILNGIYPGTKWCGRGNVSANATDLGFFDRTDRCCQEHDNCRDFIPSGKTKYGIFNDFPYTICSCDCDDRFRFCLQDVATLISGTIGSLFFDVVRIKCVEFVPDMLDGTGMQARLADPYPYSQDRIRENQNLGKAIFSGLASVTSWFGSFFKSGQ